LLSEVHLSRTAQRGLMCIYAYMGGRRPRRERPGRSRRRATGQPDELPPPHGAYPKAKDHGRSIAGVGVGQWRASQQKGRPMTGLRSSESAAHLRAPETPTGAAYLWRIFKA